MAANKMKFTLYQGARREYRWRLSAGNGRVIADSGEGYSRRANCERMIDKMKLAFSYSADAIVVEDLTEKKTLGRPPGMKAKS